jgi:hypothetical protein
MVGVEKLLVYRRDLKTNLGAGQPRIPLIAITVDDLERLELLDAQRERIASALCQRDVCYAIIEHNRVIHHSLISTRGRYRGPVDAELLCRGGIYIYDCWTHESLRGKGIYPAVLERLCALNMIDKRFALMDVWATNLSSIRGIQKAGFLLFAAFTVLRAGRITIITAPAALSPFLAGRRRMKIQIRDKGPVEETH